MFDLLATENAGIEGLIAYGLYKRDKRAWLFDYRDREGGDPTAENEREFLRVVRQDAQLERYRDEAQQRLISFAYEVVEEQKAEIERQAVAGRIEKLAQEISKKTGWRQQIISGIISSLITIAVTIILAAGIRLFGIDLLDALASLDGR